ncbi:ATP-binding cassette domain-containing protein [Amylibacter sp.]|nr:ATP-binding cassette domain-containing protein [Amylibacter sp.]
MFFRRFVNTLSIVQGWQFLTLQAFVVIVLEIISLILLSDCISMLLTDSPYLRAEFIWFYFGFKHYTNSLLVFYGISISIIYILLILLQKSFIMRTVAIAYELSSKVFSSLGLLSYTQYSKLDKPNLSAVLVPETQRAASAVISPVFMVISKSCLVITIIVYLLFQLGFTVLWFIVLFVPYLIIMFASIRLLKPNSLIITELQVGRQKIIADLYAADKILYFTKQYDRLKKVFINLNAKLGSALGQNTILAQLPKYIVEMNIGFAILIINFVLLKSDNTYLFNQESASLLLVAFLKILPSVQQIYRSISMIAGNLSSLENIVKTLDNIQNLHIQSSDLVCEKNAISTGDSRGFEFLNTRLDIHGKKVKFSKIKVDLGDIVIVSGESGLGKTTLCENLLHLRSDANIESLEDLRSDIQIMGSLYGKIGFAGQTAFADATEIYSLLSSQKQMLPSRLKHLIDLWSLSDLMKRKTILLSELSGGQKRKLSLLLALLSDTPLIFLDEPTNDLDNKSRKVLIEVILELVENQKKIFIIITHDDILKKISTKYLELSEL